MRITTRRLKYIALVAVAIAAALGALFYYRSTVGVAIPTDLRIERNSTGGFSGRGDGNNFTIQGNEFTRPAHGGYSAARVTLSGEQMREIIKRLNRANFFEASTSPAQARCVDGFTNVLTVTASQKTRTVTFSDCGESSLSWLRDLDDYLRKLVPFVET